MAPQMATHPAMTLTCLGTSDAFGTAGRHCAGYLVETPSARVLVDSGPSVLSALKSLGQTTDTIDAIFLSHLHGDHFGGVPFLLLEYTYETPRTRPLTIVGPLGTEARVFELFRALYADAGRDPLPFPVQFVELAPRGVHEVSDLRLETFQVPHMRTGIAFGLRLETQQRTLVYSGDSAWTPVLLDESRGADLFLCECSTFEVPVPGHVRYPEIEANRRSMECGALLLTHLGREMRARSGEIPETLANDGMRVVVGAHAATAAPASTAEPPPSAHEPRKRRR
jgi:ribonuclease BN (tRNA processing enzyme)